MVQKTFMIKNEDNHGQPIGATLARFSLLVNLVFLLSLFVWTVVAPSSACIWSLPTSLFNHNKAMNGDLCLNLSEVEI